MQRTNCGFSLQFFMQQVWDAQAGRRQYTFEGHEAPVYSVCPHYKENIQVIVLTFHHNFVLYFNFSLMSIHLGTDFYDVCKEQRGMIQGAEFLFSTNLYYPTHLIFSIQFIFSTAIDGKIKAWLYDCVGSRVDYDAPGHWCTTMAYSADGTR